MYVVLLNDRNGVYFMTTDNSHMLVLRALYSFESMKILTLMLLEANFANTKICKKP